MPNFYRVAEWICRAARRLFHLVVDHFFDDYYYIEPAFSAPSACWCLRRFFQVLGFRFKPAKSQLPSPMFCCLGVLFDLCSELERGFIFTMPKDERIAAILAEIWEAARTNKLHPAAAARLAGKADFANNSLFGRVGRAALAALKGRQYSSSRTSSLTPWLQASLGLLAAVLLRAPPRRMSFRACSAKPTLLYTDGCACEADPASSRPLRQLGDRSISDVSCMFFGIGAVVVTPRGDKLFTLARVDASVVSTWVAKRQHIGQVELFATLLALSTFSEYLREQSVLHFIDNNSALAALFKGYYSSQLVGRYWLLIAELRARPWLEWVDSGSNVSDPPSRGDRRIFEEQGLQYVPPALPTWGRHEGSPFRWFLMGSASSVVSKAY